MKQPSKKKMLLTLMRFLCLFAAMLLSSYSVQAQFVDRIVRPCSSGSPTQASVIVNPNGNTNVNVTPCAGGALTVNGVAVIPGGLPDPGGNGIVVRTAANTAVARTLVANTPLSVSNGNGVSGNPTLSCATCVTSAAALTLNRLIIGGGLQAVSASAISFDGITLDASTFVVKAAEFDSDQANIATNGTVRFNKLDFIGWRNELNNANIILSKDTSDRITASGGFAGNLTGNVTGNLTGNVTGTASGNALTGAVGSSGLTMNTARLLGRNTAGAGAIEEITLGTGLSFSGTTLNGNTGTVTGVTGTSPIASSGGTAPVISIADAAADGATKGAASFTAVDFNASSGNISIDYTNGQKATALVPGFLTAADWSLFNAKQAAGNYITALTGDGTASGPGSVAFTLATVNGNVGTFGSATQSLTVTANGKGLITAISAQTVTPAVGSITGLGTGIATALAVNVGTAGAPVINGGALGSPSSAGTIPAFTLGGTISGGGNQINNVIIGQVTPLAGSFTIGTFTGHLRVSGVNSGVATSTMELDQADANTSRIISWGPNGSTNGIININTTRSDGTNTITALAIQGAAMSFNSGLTNASGTPGSLCYNTSTFEITKNNALTCTVSALEYKTMVSPLNGKLSALAVISQMNPVQFAYKDDPRRLRWGFIADQLQAVDRKLGDGYDTKGNANSIDIPAILAINIKAIQELNQRIAELEKEKRECK